MGLIWQAVLGDPNYALRVFLIQKTANHQSSADAAIEFVKFDPNNPDEMTRYQHLVSIIKEKQVPAPPTRIAFTTDRTEPHQRVLLADRRSTEGLPLVGVTRDPEKAAGVLVLEQLSEDFFNDAAGIVDAAMLFHRRFGEVNISKRALYFTYAGRHTITDPNAAKIVAEASYGSYTAMYYWLTVMKSEDLLPFIQAAFSRMIHPKIRSMIRLLFALGPGPWMDYLLSLHNQLDGYTQKPQWCWFIHQLLDRAAKLDHIYAALESEPHHLIAGKTTQELVDDPAMAEHVLTQFCFDYANKQPVEEGTIRLLDLIVHFRPLASRLPPPENMPEVPITV